MILIIDAYNVLKQLSSALYITQEQRDAFVRKLSRYAQRKGHTIIVVFDGGSSRHPQKFKQAGIEVIYAGYAMSADEVIKNICDTVKYQQAALVSSDRSLGAYASYHGIACIDAHLLEDLVQDPEEPQQLRVMKSTDIARKREGHASSSELDALMLEGTQKMLVKSEDELRSDHKKRKPDAVKPSKTEKKIKKLVRKL